MNPLPYKQVYTILDGVKGKGHYVGTYMAWGVHNNGWWGEGEIKFYIDGDKEFPTINGTGTEDYFNGSYDFENRRRRSTMPLLRRTRAWRRSSSPTASINRSSGSGSIAGTFPIPFASIRDLRVTIQALGWQSGQRYLPLMDDIASVAFWYQTEPHTPFPKLPDKDHLSIN